MRKIDTSTADLPIELLSNRTVRFKTPNARMVSNRMRTGLRARFVLTQGLLLIATAIQGVTPDARELASSRMLHLLSKLAGEPDFSDHEPASSSGGICGPESNFVTRIVRSVKDARRSSGAGSPRAVARVASSPPPALRPTEDVWALPGTMIRSLCRLRC
jgi:hypothetical protein